MASIITLTTDFGYDDAYVAAVKGVILSTNPMAQIVDIAHSVEPQNIAQGAFVLGVACRYFPKNTIHLAIVDPGVGSERRGIILKTSSAVFVAPDNGILSYVVSDLCLAEDQSARHPRDFGRMAFKTGLEAAAISDPRFWRQPVSSTFHGRDIFAPVAAGLSLGISIYEFGEKITSLRLFPTPRPSLDSQGNVSGHVMYIDRFGNLITDIRNSDVPAKDVTIQVAGRTIEGLSSYYEERPGLAATPGSSGYLEIALPSGSARDFLDCIIGDEVQLITALE